MDQEKSTARTEAPASVPLQAGKALDALVAEKVMGAKGFCSIDVVNGKRDEAFAEFPGDPIHGIRRVPYYSTEIASAWEVVEQRGMSVVRSEDGWYAIQPYDIEYPRNSIKLIGGTVALADTAPLAICLAALRAIGEVSS